MKDESYHTFISPHQDPTGYLVAATIGCTAELGSPIMNAANAGNITIVNASPIESCERCPGCWEAQSRVN